jgi:hypothetical protein
MPRKKSAAADAAQDQTTIATSAVAEPPSEKLSGAPMERPAYIDGLPVNDDGSPILPNNPEAKNWGPPYKAIITTSTFEMGENRRFRQRQFTFKEKPTAEVLATLKEHGFVYRPAEKAWTITANPDTRKLTDELAQEFGGPSEGIGR